MCHAVFVSSHGGLFPLPVIIRPCFPRPDNEGVWQLKEHTKYYAIVALNIVQHAYVKRDYNAVNFIVVSQI